MHKFIELHILKIFMNIIDCGWTLRKRMKTKLDGGRIERLSDYYP